jgi:hypothetical protein
VQPSTRPGAAVHSARAATSEPISQKITSPGRNASSDLPSSPKANDRRYAGDAATSDHHANAATT